MCENYSPSSVQNHAVCFHGRLFRFEKSAVGQSLALLDREYFLLAFISLVLTHFFIVLHFSSLLALGYVMSLANYHKVTALPLWNRTYPIIFPLEMHFMHILKVQSKKMSWGHD